MLDDYGTNLVFLGFARIKHGMLRILFFIEMSISDENTHECHVNMAKANALQWKVLKVISGGQTGADRAALEAARELHIPTGGFAPEGFITSAGKDSTLGRVFGLTEVPLTKPGTKKRVRMSVAQGYVVRSKMNVDAADATVAFRFRKSIGTDKTIVYCRTGTWPRQLTNTLPESTCRARCPCLVITNITDESEIARLIMAFIEETRPRVLNIAGHREEMFAAPIRRILLEALRPFAS